MISLVGFIDRERFFRPKAKTTTIIEATENPVRKQSFSGNEGQPVTIAPQLKVDANGSLVIDEERYEDCSSILRRDKTIVSIQFVHSTSR